MMPGRTVDLIFYKEDFNMSIRKTMYVKENSFRKLDDPFNDVAKKYVFFNKMVDYLKKALIYGHTSRISS